MSLGSGQDDELELGVADGVNDGSGVADGVVEIARLGVELAEDDGVADCVAGMVGVGLSLDCVDAEAVPGVALGAGVDVVATGVVTTLT